MRTKEAEDDALDAAVQAWLESASDYTMLRASIKTSIDAYNAAISSVLEDDWQTMETARKLAYACHERMASLRDGMGIHYLREHVEREVRDTFEIVRLLSPPAEPNNAAPPKAGE